MQKNTYKAFVNIICNVLIFVLLCSIILFSLSGNVNYSTDAYAPLYQGNGNSNKVTLMINVYWGTEYIIDILDILDKYRFNTTFFVGGTWAASNEFLLKEILSRGNEIGNHGYYHKDMSKISFDDNAAEIKNCNKIVFGLTGYKITLFAPPSGSFSQNTLKAVEQLNMETIMWTRDTVDWRDKDNNIIYKRAIKNIKGGDLILMHPTKESVIALENICKFLKENNLTCDTVTNTISQ